MSETSGIVLNCSGLDALRNLLGMRRASDSKYTLSFVSRQLGIKSRSYLTEALKGKKKLSHKHVPPLVELLDLPKEEAELLRLKLLLDTKEWKPAELQELQDSIANAEKTLSLGKIELAGVRDINLMMLLAMCLYLYPRGQATRREIIELFGRDRYYEVECALTDLVRNGLMVKDGEMFSYSENFQHVLHLYGSTNKSHEIDYLKSGMVEASLSVEDYHRKQDSCIFYSGLITARQAAYLQSMDTIRQSLRTIQSRIEDKDADTLVRFNVQLYPVLARS